MTQDLETVMKNALDGNFYVRTQNIFGVPSVVARPVSKDYCPKYDFGNPFEASGKRGGYSRQLQNLKRRAAFWTPEKIAELTKLRAMNYGSRKIGLRIGASREEVRIQLNKMGIPSLRGVPFQ